MPWLGLTKLWSWRLVFKLPAIARDVLLPPPVLRPSDAEGAFRAYHARRTATQRRAGLILALPTWMAFSVLDFVNVLPGSGWHGIVVGGLIPRLLGTVTIAAGTLLSSRQQFLEDLYSSRVLYIFIVLCYFILLAMVTYLDYPFSYIVDYPGLMFYLLFALGIFRPDVRTVLLIIVTILPGSGIFLYFSNQQSYERLQHVGVRISGDYADFFASHLYISTIIYLISFMTVAYVIAVQLEREARATFAQMLELERSNREVEHKTAALLAAEEELRFSAEQANREKSLFMINAAHDLRQPAQSVILNADIALLALRRKALEEIRTAVETTRAAARATVASFDNVLDISYLETGLIKRKLTAFEIQDLVQDVLVTVQVEAARRGVNLKWRTARHGRAAVHSDRGLLARVLTNIVDNAVKYSDPAKGTRQTVLVGVLTLAKRVRIDVLDNGVGIPDHKRAEVFKPFIRLDNPKHNQERGMGIGLSNVKAIVDQLPAHTIHMRSWQGRRSGTRFSLIVPRYTQALTLPDHYLDTVLKDLDLSHLFIWCVDDHEQNLTALTTLLGQMNVMTEKAASIEDLRQQFADSDPESDLSPDLLMTDYQLAGGRTANDVIDLFMRHWGAKMPPVLVLTGEADPRIDAVFRPYVEIIRKPTPIEQLIAAIRRSCPIQPADPPAEAE